MDLAIKKKPAVQTQRLALKPFSQTDTQGLIGLLTNPEITRTFMVPFFETADQALALANRLIAFSQLGDTRHLEYGIYRDGTLIGFVNGCGIREDTIEIGYVIHPDYQGCGYATEAVGAVLRELREMGFRKVIAGFFSENSASRRVMEKCGMKPGSLVTEAEYRGVLHKCLYYEIQFGKSQSEP